MEKDRLAKKPELGEQEIVIDLVEVFFLLLKHWLPILLAAVIVGGIFGTYNRYLVAPKYKSNAQIYITNTENVLDI